MIVEKKLLDFGFVTFRIVPEPKITAAPPLCEFAVGRVSERSEGRNCIVDGQYCSPLIFRDSALISACEVHQAQLIKEKSSSISAHQSNWRKP
jgi:hypothetical protein